MIKLTIVIPFYNAESYIKELLECLDPQVESRNDVQVILVDDGSSTPFKSDRKWLEVIRQDNRGLAGARNTGIEAAKGEYISFIDADDVVAGYYVEKLIDKIDKEKFDYVEFSWKSLPGGPTMIFKLNSINDKLANVSACTRAFKMSFIGDRRFNERKRATEDEDFYRKMDFERGTKSVITEFMYFYRTTTPNSLSKQYMAGLLDVKRIVYNYKHITKDMTFLIDEIKKEDETNEVFVFTHKNDLPELEKYAQVRSPFAIKAMELRGEPTSLVKIIDTPLRTQVVFYNSLAFDIGGIETFNYNFVRQMSEYYDIIVLYETMNSQLIQRLEQFVRVEKNTGQPIVCDTLICNRIFDEIPRNVSFKKSVQVVHGCENVSNGMKLPKDRDIAVPVSQAVVDSWGKEMPEPYTVIHNMTYFTETKKMLFLVSATRLDTPEKGQKRMVQLANKLREANIPFIWVYFSNRDLNTNIENVVRMRPSENVRDYMANADYLVQLSDSEAFCYSIVEALDLNTPVITTPLDVLPEIGLKDGKNGYIVPFDMDFDVKKLLTVPKFTYNYDNKPIIKQWREILGNTKPKHDYKPDETHRWVEVTTTYKDLFFNKSFEAGDIVRMPKARADMVVNKGYGKIKD